MKKIISCGLLLAAALGCHAQKLHFGIRTSFNLATVKTDGIGDPQFTRGGTEVIGETLGLNIGGFVDVPVIAGFSLQSELRYSTSGYRYEYVGFGAQQKRFQFAYLAVPLLVKYNWHGLAPMIGLQYNALLSAKRHDDGLHSAYKVGADNVKPVHNNTDWAFIAGLEYTIKFGLGFHLRYQYPNMQDGIASQDLQAPEIKYAYQSPILNPALINNLEEKGIPFDFARKRLRQLGLTNMQTGDDFAALGLKTEDGGWWVYSSYINTFTDEKSISFFPGKKYKFQTVHIFKDVFDYLTARICFNDNEPFDDECIILNSYDCLEESAQYLRGFGYCNLFSWLGNDSVGQQATKNYALLCCIEENLKHVAMNSLYASYPDLNSWHQKQGDQ